MSAAATSLFPSPAGGITTILVAPRVRWARFRLYDEAPVPAQAPPASGGPYRRLRNHEGINFWCPQADVVSVGNVLRTETLDPASFRHRVEAVGGFFWLRFRKRTDGSWRELLGMKMTQVQPGLLRLRDLTLPNQEIRQCYVDEVTDLIADGVHTVRGPVPPAPSVIDPPLMVKAVRRSRRLEAKGI